MAKTQPGDNEMNKQYDELSTVGKKRFDFEFGLKPKLHDKLDWRGDNHPQCLSCNNAPADHLHHIQPLNEGGENVEENIIPLCAYCHRVVHSFGCKKSKFDYTERVNCLIGLSIAAFDSCDESVSNLSDYLASFCL